MNHFPSWNHWYCLKTFDRHSPQSQCSLEPPLSLSQHISTDTESDTFKASFRAPMRLYLILWPANHTWEIQTKIWIRQEKYSCKWGRERSYKQVPWPQMVRKERSEEMWDVRWRVDMRIMPTHTDNSSGCFECVYVQIIASGCLPVPTYLTLT